MILISQDDTEGHLSALYILQDLLSKHAPAFEEQFARLGLQLKIQSLAGPLSTSPSSSSSTPADDSAMDIELEGAKKEEKKVEGEGEEEEAVKESKEAKKPEEKEGVKEGVKAGDVTDGGSETVSAAEVLEDATELKPLLPYCWKEWSIVRSQDCVYLWNEFCSLELSNVSNGWFRFLLDNKLATMYSSGSTEGGPDSFGESKWNLR